MNECYECGLPAVVTFTLRAPGRTRVFLDACSAHRRAVDGLMARGRGTVPEEGQGGSQSRHAVVPLD